MTFLVAAPIAFIVAYLIGGIPFGFIAGKLKGYDIREHGSRNIGATNAARVIGWKWFPLVLLLDALKGFGPCFAGLLLTDNPKADLALVAGCGALIGHLFTPYLGFKGGKGVATGLGVVLVLATTPDHWLPWPALAGIGVFVLVLLVSRWVSLASICAAIAIPALYVYAVWNVIDDQPWLGRTIFLCAVGLFVVWKHRSNIGRLLAGKEPKIGKRA